MHSAAASKTVGLNSTDVNKEKRVRDEVLEQAVDGRGIYHAYVGLFAYGIVYYFYLLG